MIIDAQENKTLFFNLDISYGAFDYDPMNVDELNAQFHTIFEGFFFPVSNLPRI